MSTKSSGNSHRKKAATPAARKKQQHAKGLSGEPTSSVSVNALMGALIAMVGHVDEQGNVQSKINFANSDADALQVMEMPFRSAMTKAIMNNDASGFREAYQGMESILKIDMEAYEGMVLHFPAAGKELHISPSEMCPHFKAWSVFMEIFKLSMAHDGEVSRKAIDSPIHLLFRLGSWLEEPSLQPELSALTQLANDAAAHFLNEVEPAALANCMDLSQVIQKMLFLKKFPTLNQVFLTQHAAMQP